MGQFLYEKFPFGGLLQVPRVQYNKFITAVYVINSLICCIFNNNSRCPAEPTVGWISS